MAAETLRVDEVSVRPPAIADRCAEEFVRTFGMLPSLRAWAPGRINLVGGHTDVNGGLALPAAINRWVSVCIRPREDDRFIVHALDLDETFEGNLAQLPDDTTGWRCQITGLLSLFDAQRGLPSGFDAVFTGDVPRGSGLSSSAAMSVAWLMVLNSWTGANLDKYTLARLSQQVEQDFLGLPCGLLDPIASLFSEPGCVLEVDFRDLRVRSIESDFSGLSWVILHSGVSRQLAHSGYADRVRDCAQGLVALHRGYPIRHFRDIKLDMLDMDTTWARRLRHVVQENARVQEASALLQSGQTKLLGGLLHASHESLRDLYEVSCTELDHLVELGEAHPAQLGGRMMGGGFGGCTLHLVEADRAEAFITDILTPYRERFHGPSQGFALQIEAGARTD
jgi:galactokinase